MGLLAPVARTVVEGAVCRRHARRAAPVHACISYLCFVDSLTILQTFGVRSACAETQVGVECVHPRQPTSSMVAKPVNPVLARSVVAARQRRAEQILHPRWGRSAKAVAPLEVGMAKQMDKAVAKRAGRGGAASAEG